MNASRLNSWRASLRRSAIAVVVVAALGSVSSAWAQADTSNSSRRRPGDGEGTEGRRAPSAQDIQARMLSSLRDRFGVTNDEEWTVISERLLKVFELRRSGLGGGAPMFGQRGGPPGGGQGGQGGPGGGDRFRGMRPGGGSPEMAALQSALTDKLPEAEIKARLAQLRQTRKANEAKLEAAQEELRAVLTVRQEALAVLLGLLP